MAVEKKDSEILLDAAAINPYLVGRDEKAKLAAALAILKKDTGCKNPKDEAPICVAAKVFQDAIDGPQPEYYALSTALADLKAYAAQHPTAGAVAPQGSVAVASRPR